MQQSHEILGGYPAQSATKGSICESHIVLNRTCEFVIINRKCTYIKKVDQTGI